MDVSDAECSRSCGTGFKRQFHSCISPVSECGGEACEGIDNRTVACNEHCCPGMLKINVFHISVYCMARKRSNLVVVFSIAKFKLRVASIKLHTIKF